MMERMIYLHGLGQDASAWKEIAACVNGGGEFPELAKLCEGEEVCWQVLSRRFEEYCRAEDGKMILCGLSLGGILAMEYAIKHPDRVEKLILVGVQYRMPTRLLGFQNFLFRLMPESAFPGGGFGKRDFISLTKSMAELDYTEELKKIECPVLVICGAKDNANKQACAEIAEMLPDGRLCVIDGAGHELNCSHPKELAEAIRRFL